MGTASFVGTIYFLTKSGKLNAGEGIGINTLAYVLHKVTAAIFCFIMLIISPSFFMNQFGQYKWNIIAEYGMTILIASVMLLACWYIIPYIILKDSTGLS